MNEPDTTTPSTRDRAIGALVGLAAGDAVGTTLEFQRPGTFAPIDDLVGGGPFGLRPGQWTDDTSMAMCLAESILDVGDLDPADQLRRYVLWWKQGYWSSTGRCFDIGGTTTQALARFARDGSVTPARIDDNQAANGSLMRLAPAPIRYWRDPAIAAERAAATSRTTHPAPRPVDACRVYGAMIAALIGGAAFETVVDAGFWAGAPLTAEIETVIRGSWRDKEPPAIRGTGYVVDALEASIWAVAGAVDFRDAVLRAANLGDDADTTAAIAGQLAGARWGASAIPAEWRAQLSEIDRITAIAGRLHDAGDPDAPELGDDGRRWDHDDAVHGWWAAPGVLAGEFPGNPSAEVTRRKLNLLVDEGIRTFVDLTEVNGHLTPYAEVLAEVARARNLTLTRVSHPIPDVKVIHDAGYDDIVATIESERERGGVYVHCWGGIGRTATVIGCLLVDRGLDGDAALRRIADLRAGTRKAGRRAPENELQERVIRRRAAARHRGPAPR